VGEDCFPQHSSTCSILAVVLAQIRLWCKVGISWREQGIKARTVAERDVCENTPCFGAEQQKQGVTDSSGNCWVICRHFAQNRDLALSACGPPFRSLFSVAS